MTLMNPPETFLLSNGLTVVFQDYDSSVAATYWWVQVGSADEQSGEEGFAHFLEHLLFKDAAAHETGQASSGQLARAIESLGGEINAYTSLDQTVYHVTCAQQHWEKVLRVFSGMAQPQSFLEKDFLMEREVVIEEIRKNRDSPDRQLFESLFSLTFAHHPYGRPVIGIEKTLRSAKVRQIEQFYRKHYVASKMGLILVGPFSQTRQKSILKILERGYGHLRKKPAQRLSQRPLEAALRKKSSWKVKPFDVKTSSVAFSFRVPELGHADLPALDLLAGILGAGELSELHQRLFYQTSLVTAISSALYVPKDPGVLYIQADIDQFEKINRVFEEIFQVFDQLRQSGPSLEQIHRVLVSIESERLYATQTADGLASRLGFLKLTMDDLNYDERYLQLVRSVTPSQVQAVAQKYLVENRMSVVLMVPQEKGTLELSPFKDLAHQRLSTLEKKKKPLAQHSKHQRVQTLSLTSGVQVCWYPRPSSHVFSIHAACLGGLRLEQCLGQFEDFWGVGAFLGLTWSKGTVHRTAREVAAIVEGKAASLEGFSGRNSVGLQMTGLARDWNILSPLMTEVLLNPSFSDQDIEHTRRVLEDDLRSMADHSSQLGLQLFLESLFQSHPYGRLPQGNLETLQKINSEKIHWAHQQWFQPERCVLAISGSVHEAALESWLQDFNQSIEKRQALLKKSLNFPTQLTEEPPLSAPRWVERQLGRQQCHVFIGGLGHGYRSEDRYPLYLLQNVLGGQSGRLFVELREKKSLVYTVAPFHVVGIEKGYLGTYFACTPQKKQEALATVRSVFEKLAEQGPTLRELKRAQEFFLGRRAMDLQSDPALAAHFGLEKLYQIDSQLEESLIQAVTLKEIQAVCDRYYVRPFQVTSSVG